MTEQQKELNAKIIEGFMKAPESQLSERLRKKCEEFDGSNDQMEDILRSIYYGCCESSNFCKVAVDPKFTGWKVRPGDGPRLHNHKVK